MIPSATATSIAPAGQPLELLFAREEVAHFSVPEPLLTNYGSAFGLPSSCLYANFVTSLEGLVALPGDTESGQIISGRNQADRFVMGLLRACADAVLLGVGTFRKSSGHLWHADRIYPPAAAQFAELRAGLGARTQPLFVLISASGELDTAQPALADAWLFTTAKGEARLRGKLPNATRMIVQDSERIDLVQVLKALHDAGLQRVLTEGGPALFAELLHLRLVDELFLTSAPALFGRFVNDERKSLAEGLDLTGTKLELLSTRRHGSHLFHRYAVKR